MRMGRDVSCSAALRPGDRLQRLESHPEVPLLSSACPRRVLQRTDWKTPVAMCGSRGWLVDWSSEEGAANHTVKSGTRGMAFPQTLLLRNPHLQLLPGELFATDGTSQDLDAFRLPRLGTKLMHIREVGLRLCSTPSSFPGGDDCPPLETDTCQRVMNRIHPFWAAEHVHVVQETTDLLAMLDGGGNLLQSTLNSDG